MKVYTPEELNKNSTKGKVSPNSQTKASRPKIDVESFERTTFLESDSDKTRISLPSRGLFYEDIKTIKIRGLTAGEGIELKKYEATNNLSIVIDVVQSCIQSDVDVRELTQGDFFFILVYIVINSTPDAKYNIKWNSFYENENAYVLVPTSLRAKELDYKKLLEEIPDFQDRKFTPARVKHLETLLTNRHNPEDKDSWLVQEEEAYVEFIQYLDEPSPEEQAIRLKSMPLNSPEFSLLKKFITLQEHYIDQELEITDSFFDQYKAIDVLKKRLRALQELSADDSERYKSFSSQSETFNIVAIEEEISRIEEANKNNQIVSPKVEHMSMPLDIPSLIEPLYSKP